MAFGAWVTRKGEKLVNVGFIGSGGGIKSVEDVHRIINFEYGMTAPVYFYMEDGVEKSAPVSNEALTGDEVGTLFNYTTSPAKEWVEAWCRKYGVAFVDRSADNISYWLDSYAFEEHGDYGADEDYEAEEREYVARTQLAADPDPFSDNPASL